MMRVYLIGCLPDLGHRSSEEWESADAEADCSTTLPAGWPIGKAITFGLDEGAPLLSGRTYICVAHEHGGKVAVVKDAETIGGTMRPSFEEINMRMAMLVSERSTCKRLNVGCIITSTDFRKVLSMGYNGNASGLPNTCDSNEPGKCGCIHAEQNAVINCDSPRSTDKIIFTTNLPCPVCAKFMVNLGNVQKVYYREEYRIRKGLDILDLAGIPYEQLKIA